MLVIAHRGASGYTTENSLPAFMEAMALGSDMIELDVRRCASGEIVVFHDDRLDRITRAHGFVNRRTLTELRTIPLLNGASILTLEEALLAIGGRLPTCIELKEPDLAREVCALVQRMVREQHHDHEAYRIISFWHRTLSECKYRLPQVRTGAVLVGECFDLAANAAAAGADSIHPNIHFLSAELVQDAHRRGMRVYPWTVDDPEHIRKCYRLGVDGITSNYPDRVRPYATVG